MKNYHHGNLKEELISCACVMCERDGYTKLSIRSLAKESNVPQTAPYRHFKTKEDLCLWIKLSKKNNLVGYDKILSNWRKLDNFLCSSSIQKVKDGFTLY